MNRAALALLVTCLVACAAAEGGEPACADRGGLHPVCGFRNPEDLAAVGGGSQIVVSEMGSMLDRAARGRLTLLDLASEAREIAYPRTGSEPSHAEAGWGEPSCPGEPGERFNPHGIDLAARPDGRLQLLAVNHGGRESIEFFEVVEGGDGVAVHWRGCAVAPEGLFFNDVVQLPDGGFLATHMFGGNAIWGVLRSRMGTDTGAVYEWQAPASWSPVPGTEAPFPNGIELSPDGREIYLNAYSAGEVRRISRETGELLAVARVRNPDNSSWARDGRLLVASHAGGFANQVRCWNLERGACPMPFEIVALEPLTLAAEPVFALAGEPLGGGTVALDRRDELVIGAMAGDRILRVAR